MSKHTPGPWKFEHTTSPYFDTHTGERRDMHYYDIVGQRDICGTSSRHVVCHMSLTDDRSENASLLAASPDMLDMLKTIENDSNQVPDWLWNKIQAVIAKAEEKL